MLSSSCSSLYLISGTVHFGVTALKQSFNHGEPRKKYDSDLVCILLVLYCTLTDDKRTKRLDYEEYEGRLISSRNCFITET